MVNPDLPRIRLFTNHVSEEGGFYHLYGKLINDYQLLPLADEVFDTKQGTLIFIYKNHIAVHVNYGE